MEKQVTIAFVIFELKSFITKIHDSLADSADGILDSGLR